MTTAETIFDRDFRLFSELNNLIEDAGLKNPVYLYYLVNAVTFLTLLGLCCWAINVAPYWWERVLLMPIATGFVLTHLSFIAHDAGHEEVDPHSHQNNILVLLQLTALLGISGIWWTIAHNGHHTDPNHETKDPNLRVSALTFSERQGTGKYRRWQAFYYVPAVMSEIILMHKESLKQIAKRDYSQWPLEAFGMTVYFVSQIGFLAWALGWEAIPFAIICLLFRGLYLGGVFAPNHKGMRVIAEGEEVGFLEKQLTTTRNVKPGVITDFVMGGLNYQAEHHLFPMIPRFRLKKAHAIIKAYCLEHGLFYYEVSIWRSYYEMFRFFDSFRKGKSVTVPVVWDVKAA